MPDLAAAAIGTLERLRRERPLIHIISNFVTLADVANAALAIGARPVMAHAVEEVPEITQSARALALNLGTPSPERLEAMLAAGQTANAQGIPIILDPVGVGAAAFRRAGANRLLDSLRIAVVRGNASEIGALAGMSGAQSGVDAVNAGYDRALVARRLARQYRCTVAITGAVDFLSDGERSATFENGSPLLQSITGAGDMLDALVAAAAAVEKDAFTAAASALLWFGIAADRAASEARGAGSFRVALLDMVGELEPALIQKCAKYNFSEEGKDGNS